MQNSSTNTQGEPQDVFELASVIYRQKRDFLLSIAYANTNCKADAEGAVQTAFLSFVVNFDPEGDSPPLPWLILTLKRECWRRARQGRYNLRRIDSDPEARYEETGVILEAVPAPNQPLEEMMIRREGAQWQLRRLKLDQCAALSLQAMGYSYKEIAEMNDWTYTKVSRCLREAREALAA